jgi:hypothetical protein
MSISFLPFIEREEREREEKVGGGGVEKTIYSVQKVSRQCLLVLLIRVKHMIRINSKFSFYGVRGAEFERNLI